MNLDDSDNRPSLATVLSTAEFYGLSAEDAESIVEQVADVVDDWQAVAAKFSISRADVLLTASALGAHAEYRAADAPIAQLTHRP